MYRAKWYMRPVGCVCTEKFWRENVMAFENDEFRAIRKLVKLLDTTTDKTTLAVVCYDLGEFARLHPAGKK